MSRWGLLVLCAVVLQGCAHKIAVVTLESTIEQAAVAAKKAAGNASDKVTVEASVTNGYKGSTTIPVPVVPIGLEASLTQTAKVTIDVQLKDYVPPSDSKKLAAPTRYLLDTETGALEAAE